MTRKRILLCFTICILLLTGCSNKNNFSNYEHLNLEGKNILTHSFGKDTYAIADISNSNDEEETGGLFYKIDDTDYILLDKIDSCGVNDIYDKQQYNYFYNDNNINKLYVVRCQGRRIIEYTLNKEKIEQKELSFDTTSISNKELENVMISSINNIDNDNIYFRANLSNGNRQYFNIKCSLKNNKCEKFD